MYEQTLGEVLEARAKFLERTSVELLASVLPGSLYWHSVSWHSSTSSGELDGLVTVDDVSLLLQCKAGRMSAPARRGSTARMKRDVGKLIKEAAEQHRALSDAITEHGKPPTGFDTVQAHALEALLQFEVIVCLDDVTVWSTHAHELRDISALPEGRHVPWILSLTDLMAVVDLLQGTNLINYLVRRQRIERDGRIYAHDELDWVGHYILEGLFFDAYFEAERARTVFAS